jgi:Leucine Rich repeat
MAQNKRALEKTAPYYEDNSLTATGVFKLLTQEDAQMREQDRSEAIRGIDPDYKLADPNFLAKLPPDEQLKIEKVRGDVEKEIETVVDFAYYYLTNDAFATLLPVLEVKFFSSMTELDLRGNSIDDEGILNLCDAFLSAHVNKLRILHLEETQVGEKGVLSLIEIMQSITTLYDVRISQQAEVSK